MYRFARGLAESDRAVWKRCSREQRMLWLKEELVRDSLAGIERELFAQLTQRQRRAFIRPLVVVEDGSQAGDEALALQPSMLVQSGEASCSGCACESDEERSGQAEQV